MQQLVFLTALLEGAGINVRETSVTRSGGQKEELLFSLPENKDQVNIEWGYNEKIGEVSITLIGSKGKGILGVELAWIRKKKSWEQRTMEGANRQKISGRQVSAKVRKMAKYYLTGQSTSREKKPPSAT